MRPHRYLTACSLLAAFALPGTSAQDQAVWRFGFESTEGLTTGWGQSTGNIALSLNQDPAHVSEGQASVRLSGRTGDGRNNRYLAIEVPVPEVDLTGRMLTFSAWTSLPEATRALYVRAYDKDGQCVVSWLSWSGILGTNLTHSFGLQPGISMNGLGWEPSMVTAEGRPVTRLEFIIGTGQDNAEYDLFLDDLAIVPERFRRFDEVKTPKPLYPLTKLAEDGRPLALVVRPEDPAYDAAVQKLVDGVRAASGATLEVRTDAAARQDLRAAIAEMSASNVILLGNVHNNRAILPLYSHMRCFADGVFPGEGGYELRTVHDPWATGKNVLVIGATDAAGAAAGVEALIGTFVPHPELVVPPMVKVHLGPEATARWGYTFQQELGEAYLKQMRDRSEELLQSGSHTGLGSHAAGIGEQYALTGRDDYAKAFVAVMRRWKEFHDSEPDTFGGPWGMDADFTLYRLVPAWDAIEESPAVTDDDRLAVAKILFEFTSGECVNHAIEVLGNDHVRHNHATHAALGLLFAGEYFSRYYNSAEAQQWLEIADACFQVQAKAWKPHEDCNGYQWLTLDHLVRYALARPDLTYFENGNARKGADYAILGMDNLGYQVTYGDTGAFTGWWSELPVLQAAAWFYGDPGYQWAIAKKIGVPGRVALGEYAKTGEGEPPTRLLGVQAFPVDPEYYRSLGGEKAPPLEKTVDKVVMRSGFDPEDQYLLFDGLSNGGHRHYDGQSISRWTEDGRIWLADADYIKSLPKYHNGVLIIRDGQSQTIPDWCELERAGELPHAGFSKTKLSDYAGADWHRSIIWLKGTAFVVADEMVAREKASFSFRPIWQTIGTVKPAPNGVLVTQAGRHAAIISPPTGRALLSDDRAQGANWSGYQYADEPVVRVLQQVYDADLEAGQKRTLFTVLRATGEKEPSVAASSPGEGSIYADLDGIRVLIGVGSPESEATLFGASIRADAFIATPEFLAAFGLRSLSYAGQTASATEPVDIEIDLTTHRATIRAERPTLMTVPELGETPVPAGETQIDLPAEANVVQDYVWLMLQQAAQAPQAGQPGSPVPEGLPALRKLFSYREKLPAYLLTGNRGAFEAVDTKLETTCDPQPLARNVFSPNEQEHNDLAGLTDGQLLTTDGGVMWDKGQTVTLRVKLDQPYDISAVNVKAWYATSSSKRMVYQVRSVRVEGSNDGFANDVRVLGEVTDTESHGNWGDPTYGPHTYAPKGLKGQVRELRLTIAPRVGDQVELPQPPDHPGAPEPPIAAGIYLAELEVWGNREGLEADPKAALASGVPVHQFQAVAVADVDADGAEEIIAGSSNGSVTLLGRDGTQRWSVDTGGAVNAVAAAHIIDQGLAVIAGSMGGRVTALRPDGTELWHFDVPYYKRPPHVRVVLGAHFGDGKPAVVVGADSWRYYALAADGRELWHYESVHGSTAGAAGDVDGDGVDEVACGTEYYWWHLVGADGKARWQYSTHTGPTANAVAVGDLNGDGKREVLFGGADANVHAISSDGKLLWEFNTGDEVTAVTCADVDGDGAEEALVGSLSFNVYALKGDGRCLWRRDLGTPVVDLCMVGKGAEGRVCAASREGRVCVLNARTGEWAAMYDLGAAPLRVAGGDGEPRLVATATDGNLYGLTW